MLFQKLQYGSKLWADEPGGLSTRLQDYDEAYTNPWLQCIGDALGSQVDVDFFQW
jgi:hypothetical protein